MCSSTKSPTAWRHHPALTITRLPSWPAPSLMIPATIRAACRGSSHACSAEIPRKRCLRPPSGTRRPPPVSKLRRRQGKRKACLARLWACSRGTATPLMIRMRKTRLRRLRVVTAASRRSNLKTARVRPGVDMLSWIRISSVALLFAAFLVLPLQAQNTEQLEVGPPPLHRVNPPAPGASPEQLEQRGDELRTQKNFLDAVDYYQAALKGAPGSASLFNKIGICQLMMQRYKEAKKSFERAIKADRKHGDAYNNLGAAYYELGILTHQSSDFTKAIKVYDKAIALSGESASYFSNRGAAYFAKKKYEQASVDYSAALHLDPDLFERTSRGGLQAQLASPEDRARYDYVLAKLYASAGAPDRSLHYLKKAMEEGYKNIKDVYKDNEFSTVRKDPRFAELMAAKTPAIPD